MQYLECLSKNFPELQVVCFGNGTVYEELMLETGGSLPPKSQLDSLIFSFNKEQKIAELSSHCEMIVTQGFKSNALGYDHIYDSEVVDQINIIGTVNASAPTPDNPYGISLPYAVRPIENDIVQPKIYKIHSHFQLRKALADGALFKLGCLQRFNALRDYVNSLNTNEEVLNVTWETQLP